MPILNVGDKAGFDRGGMFAQLKNKNEKIYLRILGSPYYDGKHFMLGEDGKWTVTNCPKIINGSDCAYCNKHDEYFAIAKNEKNKKQKELLDKKVREFKVKITFYYPILDRTDTYNKEDQKDGIARIFKTAISVRIKIDDEKENDINVFEYDFIVTRKEEPGAGYYSLNRLDSKKILPFSDVDKTEIEKAKAWDLAKMIEGKQSSQLDEEPK